MEHLKKLTSEEDKLIAARQELFNLLADQHDILLLQTEMQEIISVCRKIIQADDEANKAFEQHISITQKMCIQCNN